jgi:hypothetical protein
VEAHGQRFYKTKFLDGEVGGIELFARYADVLRHRAVALYAHRLIPLTGIDSAAKTCSADTATGVWREGDGSSGRKIDASLTDPRSDLVTENTRKLHHGIASTKGA